MRHHSSSAPPNEASNNPNRSDWQTLKSLWPYIWASKYRVLIALSALILAKLANLAIPTTLKHIVDAMTPNPTTQALLVVPVALLLAYGALRISQTLFNELREIVFFQVVENAARTVSLKVFNQLHNLSLRFHLSRQFVGCNKHKRIAPHVLKGCRNVKTYGAMSFSYCALRAHGNSARLAVDWTF